MMFTVSEHWANLVTTSEMRASHLGGDLVTELIEYGEYLIWNEKVR